MGDGTVNMVSAPVMARERGIRIVETRKDAQGAYGTYVRLLVTTPDKTRSVAATLFSDGRPRFIQIKGIGLEAEPMPHMLYTVNADQPGVIGALGTRAGEIGVNIATFNLGRSEKGGEAITLMGVDEPLSQEVLSEIAALPQISEAKALEF
jgi:D-3-phosphoglycerate dehydrogenase